jgi:hypothetical protein
MVLVDSTAPAPAGQRREAPPGEGGTSDLVGRLTALASASARLGLGGLVGTPSHVRSTLDEYAQASSSMQDAASLRDFADKPLIVLTAGTGHDAAWSADQDALAALSTTSVHRIVAGTSHAGLITDKEGAAATTRAILDVVASVRTAQPLAG